MADIHDYYDQLQNGPMEVWNPKTRKNVSIGSPGEIDSYVASNYNDYKDYTGAIAHSNRSSRPITLDDLGYTTASAPAKPNTSNPFDTYRRYDVRNELFGNDIYKPQMDEIITNVRNDVRVGPGLRPNVGFLPGTGAVNLENMLPFDYWDNAQRAKAKRHNLYAMSPVEERLTRFYSDLPTADRFPRFREVSTQPGVNFRGFPGRGFEYRGTPSDRGRELENMILNGNITPDIVNELAALNKPRLGVPKRTPLQRFANDIWGPAVIAGVSAIGGLGGPLMGAGFGAMAAGSTSRWEDPAAIALGAAGGALGGWGAGAGAEWLGASPYVAQIASGAGGGFGNAVGRGIGSGDFNWEDIVRATAIGGTGAAVSGSVVPTTPGVRPTPIEHFTNTGIRAGTNATANAFWPTRKRRKNPYDY